jgi:uncharacterized protein YecT (DUF1311 family)
MKMKKILILATTMLLFGAVNAQSLKTVEQIKAANQKCLDKGENMYECALEYYFQADSLLNVVYKKLRQTLNAEEQLKLKTVQLQWLKKRDKYFQKVITETKKECDEGSYIFRTSVEQQEADYVIKRVIELINKL